MNIFALTSYGLEAVSAGEMRALAGVTVTGTGYRRITAGAETVAPLVGLRTVDDVYIDVGTWEGIRHTREMLPAIQWYAAGLELEAAVAAVAAVRAIPAAPMFSITASFVGKRNYNADEIKAAAAQGIRAEYGWRYTADDREADLNIRIFIEHETAYVGVRLSKHPLHERGYKVAERPGSLKGSAAAALLRLVDLRDGQRLLDPCCGTGTILIEAALAGAIARGGDNDAGAVVAARENAAAAGVDVGVEVWDARSLPLADGSFERVATNLPWGKQVTVDSTLEAFYRDVCGEMARVTAGGGQVAVLTSLPHLLDFSSLTPIEMVEISLYGQRPTICVYSK